MLVKRLRDLFPSPDAVSRFRRELEITRRAAGEGVIGAFEFLDEGGSVGIVVEDFGTCSLAATAAEQRPPLELVLKIAVQIADALARIHRLDIVHKDVNPSNIVLNEETGVAKLIDFGTSQVLSRESVEAKPVTSGRLSLESDLRAMEMLRGLGNVE